MKFIPAVIGLVAAVLIVPGDAQAASFPNWMAAGGYIIDAPAVAVAPDGTKYVVVTSGDYRIYLETISPSGAISGWREVSGGGITPSGPAAVFDNNGLLRIYVRGTDNHLYVNVGQTYWHEVPGYGVIDAAPAAALYQGSVYLLVRGTDEALYAQIDAPGQNSWAYHGGSLASAPAAAVAGGKLYVAVAGTDFGSSGRVYVTQVTSLWTNSGFQNWGGQTSGVPGIAPSPSGGLNVYIRNPDKTISVSQNGAGFASAGDGLLARGPAANLGPDNQDWLFVVGTNNSLYFKTLGSSTPPGGICGLLDDGQIHVAPQYTSLAPPQKGQPFTDPAFGCTYYRMSDGQHEFQPNHFGVHHEYIMSPINADDSLLLASVGSTPVIYGLPAGNIVVPLGDPSLPAIGQMMRWRHDNGDQFIYFGDGIGHGRTNQFMQYSVAGRSSQVLHTFNEYTQVDFGGGHASIASSNCCIAMRGTRSDGLVEHFVFNYVAGTKYQAQILHGAGASGISLASAKPAGTTSISLAKTAGTGNWSLWQGQDEIGFLTVQGDSTVYRIVLSAYPNDTLTVAPGAVTGVTINPPLAKAAASGAPVTVYFKSNSLMIIGNQYVVASGSGGTTVTELYDINMNYLRTVANAAGHSDAGYDLNGRPSMYMYSGNDPTSPCHGEGLEKINVLNDSRICLYSKPWWYESEHYSVTADGQWVLVHNTDVYHPGTTVWNNLLPWNWTDRWGLYMNEVMLVKTDGSEIRRLAHTRSRVTDMTTGGYNYWAVPRVAISYDGKWGVFDSNFGQDLPVSWGDPYTDVYAIKIKE